MVAVDSLRPPRKNTKTVVAAKTYKPVPQKQVKTTPLPATRLPDEHARRRLLWYLVLGTMLAIVLAWIFVFPTPSADKTNNSYLSALGQKFSTLWKTIKTDILRIKEEVGNTNTNSEEQIKHLENEVFPQFNDPSKQ